MSASLRVLLVEDSEADEALILRELRRGGYEPTLERVRDGEAFKAALDAQPWDVIISDHTLPGYSGLVALADLRMTGKDIPFILVSGTIGETIAVEAMRGGAQDYVLKGDLTRLPAAISREVREAAGRAQQTQMRERLMMSERMASAGMLAAGVAHEINNPLAVAIGNLDFTGSTLARVVHEAAELSSGEFAADPGGWLAKRVSELEEPLSDMREALQRIRDIVRDVRLFSRPSDEARGLVDVRRAIDSSCRMAQNEIRHRARLVKDYREVPPVDANESHIGQVILNLLVNAAHSLPEGHAGEHEIRVGTRTSDRGAVLIEVADTGSGIAPENIARIFDPFFSTKPPGVGTGLGLAICKRIVDELGGQIEVESEIGKGTRFRVLLPAASARHGLLGTRSVPPISVVRGRVLIVDDDEAIGRALARSLSEHHDVFVTTRGEEALQWIVAGERFDAILSDLMMPDIPGMELHQELQTVARDQAERMIFLTGGAFTPAAREFLDRVANPRVEKPMELTNLLAI
ncbi:MAG TPA: response regulator, partial [Polyangiaceae bacterium]|nr:response regulator [Polyangiaceae bacterium]